MKPKVYQLNSHFSDSSHLTLALLRGFRAWKSHKASRERWHPRKVVRHPPPFVVRIWNLHQAMRAVVAKEMETFLCASWCMEWVEAKQIGKLGSKFWANAFLIGSCGLCKRWQVLVASWERNWERSPRWRPVIWCWFIWYLIILDIYMYVNLDIYIYLIYIVVFLRWHGVSGFTLPKKISLSQMIFQPWSHHWDGHETGPSVSVPSTTASLAPGEMIEVIQQTANSGGGQTRITLHCIGHSMGGLIVRGALPILMEKLNNVDLGSLAEIRNP